MRFEPADLLRKEDFTMATYESRELLPMPFPKKLKEMTDEELTKLLTGANNYNVLIPALIEANTRKDRAIAELSKRIAFLEDKALKKAGRPKTCYYVNGQELTDDYLIYLIDYDYFTIRELEKEVHAGKNQLRNRYNKAKKKQKLQKEANQNGNR